MTDSAAQRLIVALDVGAYGEAADLVARLSPHVGWFKVGSVLFTREGPNVCRLVKDSGARLFLDLKFHDIPNTVRGAVRSAIQLDVDMMTVHGSGGEAMLRAAVEAREETSRNEVRIVAVTVLTHLALEDSPRPAAADRPPQEAVLAIAELAQRTGLDGVVASAGESSLIKRRLGSGFTVVTPGIRMPGDRTDDQVRVATPGQAIRDGADYLVVGRPVVAASDPVGACERILADMTV